MTDTTAEAGPNNDVRKALMLLQMRDEELPLFKRVVVELLLKRLPDDIRSDAEIRLSARHDPSTIMKLPDDSAAVSGGQENDDQAELVVPGLSSGDIADIAKDFGVNPGELMALVQTPEFERMVAEELAKRAEQES